MESEARIAAPLREMDEFIVIERDAVGSPSLEVEADVQKLSRLSEKLIELLLAKPRRGDRSLWWGPIEESDAHHCWN